MRYLSIPYPAGTKRDEADAAWLAEVQRIARARGIDLSSLLTKATGPGRTEGRLPTEGRTAFDARTAPHPAQQPAGPAELVGCMRQLRQWAGNPSLRELAQRAGPGRLPRSSVSDVLNHPEALPDLTLLRAFVQACGGQLYWSRWVHAWRWLTTSAAGRGAENGPPPG